MTINKEMYRWFIQRFAKEEKAYKIFAEILNEIFLRAAKLYAPTSIVQTRPKSIFSFTEKIIGKNKYAELLSRRAVEILIGFIHTTGHPHPHLETIKNNFASLLIAMG